MHVKTFLVFLFFFFAINCVGQPKVIPMNQWLNRLETFALYPKIDTTVMKACMVTNVGSSDNWFNFPPTHAVRFGLHISDSVDERKHPYLSALAYKRWKNSDICPPEEITVPKTYLKSVELFDPGKHSWQPFRTDGPFLLSHIAEVSATTEQAWKNANPHLIYEIIPTSGAILFFPVYESSLIDSMLDMARVAYRDYQKELAKKSQAKYYSVTVKSGQSLSIIAERENVRVSEIMRWNKLASDRIYPGQKLLIQGEKVVQQKTESVNKTEPMKKSEPVSFDGETIDYTVKPGDSLWLIAQNHDGVSVEEIMSINDLKDANIIAGQVLKLPKK
ncbi:MAG: LysM peptidoglycan-binding domain-containing protein [Cryomorphaceae bacterium]|nr:LysM peptidoglycan-binding domain-containing protein [Cryomorphaceae bacterium]